MLCDQGLNPPCTGGNSCTLSAADALDCAIPTLAEGATYRVTVTAQTADDCGQHLNTVTVAAPNENPQGTAPNTDGHTTTVECPDITVVKTGSGTVTAGAPISYTVDITNNGPGTANNVNIVGVDTLPDGDSTGSSRPGSRPGRHGRQRLHPHGGGRARLLDPDAGGRRHLSGDGHRATDGSDCGQHPNTVTVAAANENPQGPASNTDDTRSRSSAPTSRSRRPARAR